MGDSFPLPTSLSSTTSLQLLQKCVKTTFLSRMPTKTKTKNIETSQKIIPWLGFTRKWFEILRKENFQTAFRTTRFLSRDCLITVVYITTHKRRFSVFCFLVRIVIIFATMLIYIQTSLQWILSISVSCYLFKWMLCKTFSRHTGVI